MPGAGLDRHLAPAGDERADGDAHLHVAAAVEVAHRAGVGPAPGGLELVDDLHGPHLGGAGHGPGREPGPQHVQRAQPGGEPPADLGDEVHDVGVPLHRAQRGDLHRADRRDAPDVVAAQVDEHHVLGVLLGVGAQLGLEPRVLGRVGAAPAGAGDGAERHLAVLQLDEGLGRATPPAPALRPSRRRGTARGSPAAAPGRSRRAGACTPRRSAGRSRSAGSRRR